MDSGGPKVPCIGWGPWSPRGSAILGVVPPFLLDYVSSKHLLQEQCHGESVASELAQPPQGWQARGQCGFSSEFFDQFLILTSSCQYSFGIWLPFHYCNKKILEHLSLSMLLPKMKSSICFTKPPFESILIEIIDLCSVSHNCLDCSHVVYGFHVRAQYTILTD